METATEQVKQICDDLSLTPSPAVSDADWRTWLDHFQNPVEIQRETVNRCPVCGLELRRRTGKFGEFWGCSGYPACRYTLDC